MDATRPTKRGAALKSPWTVVVVNEVKLSRVLSEFARTLITDFPIQGILDRLVERIVEVLPITSAGVTLISAGSAPHFIAASDDAALRFERLQSEICQGPCLAAFETGHAVAISDLRHDRRFPLFSPAAVEAGLMAVFTFPLRNDTTQLGALDLYRGTAGELDAQDMEAAQTLADVAAAYILNATARYEAQVTSDRFHHSSLHDALTGLANRALLQERLEHAGRRAKRSHHGTAVVFVDLDDFKQVNDTHGHQTGDELLRAVALRLSGLIRSGDTLSRFSGDEFVFLCEDLVTSADIESLATRISGAFTTPFALDTMEVSITASVGVAFAEHGQPISNDLIVRADKAMYQIKAGGGNGHVVADLHDPPDVATSNLEDDLRAALTNDGLSVAYQTIVRAADQVVTAVEALVRWTHPRRGPIAALSIVRLAEGIGVIDELGAWVLRQACLDAQEWTRQHGDTPLDLAVNVSPRELLSPGYSNRVAAILAETGMKPTALVLEMTEGIIIDDSERAIAALGELHDLGIRLALDDFGTGYSSLSYLGQLPVDIVKIDRSFIAQIENEAGRTIVAAVTDLAHALHLHVIAEGVETPGQHEAVRRVGCDFFQGFYFASPVAAFAITAKLDAVRTAGEMESDTMASVG